MPEVSKSEKSEQKESRPKNESKDIISDYDINMLIEDHTIESNQEVHKLISNIKEYTNLINQLAITEDVLIDIGIIKMVNYNFDKEAEKTEDNDEEDPLLSLITITEATKALEKVIRYQKSLEVRKEFKENKLIMLRKKLKKWCYEKTKNKKQLSILFFLGF
ncbi:25913_t:CDS:1 [Dentiscutata erythropus]|uniref:25913_t:CDS:1 n=1 Tax=Dentiscutata erythropus TaxID=1348616 RepID=A0A9N9AM32_9GLOM|nr:25913_t:CDS:1 [Dentiscutata erythropus]